MDINAMDTQLNQNINTGNISTDDFLAIFSNNQTSIAKNQTKTDGLSTASTKSSASSNLNPPLLTVDREVKLSNMLDISLSSKNLSTFSPLENSNSNIYSNNNFNDTLLYLNNNFLNNSNYSVGISQGSPGGIINYTLDPFYNQSFTNTTESNITEVIWDGRYPSGYTLTHIIIASVIVTILMIIIIVGNMLVIIAIATEKSLKNIQNWFIASLAVADFFLGLIIMPFSLANELMGYWIFGSWWCDIHSAMDVLLCTASIMNLCLISLDRYWSITKAVDYLKSRTPARAALMIAAVWVMSALICIPPLLGWKVKLPEGPLPKCALSENIGYVIYSALGSFYIPSCIMVFVYIRIYFAAKARARRGIKKHPRKLNNEQVTSFTTINKKGTIPMPSSTHNTSLKAHQLRQIATIETPPNSATLPMQIPTVTCDLASDISTSEAGDMEPQPIIYPSSNIGLSMQSPDTLKVGNSGIGKVGLNVPVPPSMVAEALASSTHNGSSLSVNINGLVVDTTTGSITAITTTSAATTTATLKPTLAAGGANNSPNELRVSPIPGRCRALSVGVDTDMPIFGKKSNQRRDEGKAAAAATAKPEKQQEIVKAELEPVIPKLQKPRDPEKEKRRIARKKEKRATLILGLIMGSFIACWLPFFFLYILVPACRDHCHIPDSAFAIAFWLGYMNSALNPAIYTIFNKDFRRAFRRILFK